ncbi:MAG: mechanosensitive ion channel family protein [Eubacteriales bacterium]|nr:mechanosensitive ion channel family protein [Eubacteriales bacterium]
MNLESIITSIVTWLTTEGVKVVVALVVLFVSFGVIGQVTKRVRRHLEKREVDKTIRNAVTTAANILLKIVVVMALLGYLGIETAGITTVLATLGVGVSLAVQGTLSNFAGGLLILITRPFKDDDYIEVNGVSGTVEDLNIVYTHIRTPDNKIIVIPNGQLANSTITNYSKKSTRRLDIDFSISYESDYHKAIGLILDYANKNDMILKEPQPFARMTKQDDSAIIITARFWVKSEDYWTINFDALENIYDIFIREGIDIPYNKLDVNIIEKIKQKTDNSSND